MSCNTPSQIKLSEETTQEIKNYEAFEGLKSGTSLIGKSFIVEIADEKGETLVLHVSLHRPEPGHLEIIIEERTYVITNEKMNDLEDIRSHKEGLGFVGKGKMPLVGIPVKGEAIVKTAEWKRALLEVRKTKPDNLPQISIKADVPGMGEQNIEFSPSAVK